MKHFGDIIPQERNPASQEMRRPAEARPFKGAPSKLPSMQFFGPSDFVPELPHNVQVETPQAICKDSIVFAKLLTRAWSGRGGEPAGWESEGWKFPSEISIQARAGVAGGAKVGAKTQVAFFNA